jgi:hypothetical protein
MARTWDYNVVDLNTSDGESIRNTLNERDQDGWELVTVTLTPSTPAALIAVFKQDHKLVTDAVLLA